MRAKNQAYLAAAGYSNPGYSNTGGTILPNLGRTTSISFPTEDESSIGRRTMTRGSGSKLLPGVLAYLTDSDLPMLVDKTSKKRSGRGAAAAVADDEVADAKLATAAGMSHGKAFVNIIKKEAIAAAGDTSATNPAEDAGEDLGEGAASVSEEGEGAASGSDEEAPPAPAAAVGGGAAAAAIAAELREEGAPEAPVAVAGGAGIVLEGGRVVSVNGVPVGEDIVVPVPGENTVEKYLAVEHHGAKMKAGTINVMLGKDAFASTKVEKTLVVLSDDMGELKELESRLKANKATFKENKQLKRLVEAGLKAVRSKIRVVEAAPYRARGGAVGGATNLEELE
jgi:hypothetical protein